MANQEKEGVVQRVVETVAATLAVLLIAALPVVVAVHLYQDHVLLHNVVVYINNKEAAQSKATLPSPEPSPSPSPTAAPKK